MFTFVVNNDTMKVIGLINPCHKPSQKPAGSGPVSTSSFGPAAQAASSSAVPESSKAHLAPDLIDKRTLPKLCLSRLRILTRARLEANGSLRRAFRPSRPEGYLSRIGSNRPGHGSRDGKAQGSEA